jgi:hypothetical protein
MEAYKQLVQSKTVRAKHVDEPHKGEICVACSSSDFGLGAAAQHGLLHNTCC